MIQTEKKVLIEELRYRARSFFVEELKEDIVKNNSKIKSVYNINSFLLYCLMDVLLYIETNEGSGCKQITFSTIVGNRDLLLLNAMEQGVKYEVLLDIIESERKNYLNDEKDSYIRISKSLIQKIQETYRGGSAYSTYNDISVHVALDSHLKGATINAYNRKTIS